MTSSQAKMQPKVGPQQPLQEQDQQQPIPDHKQAYQGWEQQRVFTKSR